VFDNFVEKGKHTNFLYDLEGITNIFHDAGFDEINKKANGNSRNTRKINAMHSAPESSGRDRKRQRRSSNATQDSNGTKTWVTNSRYDQDVYDNLKSRGVFGGTKNKHYEKHIKGSKCAYCHGSGHIAISCRRLAEDNKEFRTQVYDRFIREIPEITSGDPNYSDIAKVGNVLSDNN